MTAAKDHLTGIINGLNLETGVGEFRFAFVGYRDYRDPNRVVTSPFQSYFVSSLSLSLRTRALPR